MVAATAADHAVQYLRSHQRVPVQDNDQLNKLINHIQNQPDDDPVTQALDSPLILGLVRDDPHSIEHILKAQLHTRDQVEDFLLGRVLPHAYRFDGP